MRRLRLTMSIIASLSFVLLLVPLGLMNNASFAQTPNATNQTTAKMTGQPETTVLNKTTIPAQQTTVTVNQTSKPMTNQTLQPLENLANKTQPPPSLSGIQNKTIVTPIGNATTTVVNKTTVPFTQTMVTGGSNNQSQQQQQTSNATTPTTTTTTPPPPATNNTSSGNQSQQQGGENPLSKIPILGKLFGGK